MKKTIRFGLFCAFALLAACAPRERTVVLLSTNDIHARIERFPQLAAAVEACRDTARIVFLVDAGDRWTGNAYVDMAEGRRPILELMNRLGYDAATVGNHEFDPGQGVLGDMLRFAEFPVVCANLLSDTTAVPQPEPCVVVKKHGVKVGFVGVVTNYEGDGHPAGQEAVFRGLSFPDPQRMEPITWHTAGRASAPAGHPAAQLRQLPWPGPGLVPRRRPHRARKPPPAGGPQGGAGMKERNDPAGARTAPAEKGRRARCIMVQGTMSGAGKRIGRAHV